MRVYVLDDDERVRRTIERTLEHIGMEVVSFDRADAFLEVLPILPFGCLLLDIGLPGSCGLDVLEDVLRVQPDFPVVMATGSTDVDDAVSAFRSGAIHFLRKPFRREQLIQALREADEIGTTRREAAELRQRAQQVRLSKREREVLGALAAGSQSKMIAFDLGLSVRTVDMHRSNIFAKLAARNASQAVAIARSLDLLPALKVA